MFFPKHFYTPLNTIYLSKERLLENLAYLSDLNEHVQIAPVLKSNAYGHGIVEIAKILDTKRLPFFCIDSLYEAYTLYKEKVATPLLIMGYVDPANLAVKKLPFSYAIYTLEYLKKLYQKQPHAAFHLFIDTGMHREGMSLDELLLTIDFIKQKNITVDGVMSHLASGDDAHKDITKKQIQNFAQAKIILEKSGIVPRYRHLAASGAKLREANYPDGLWNIARVGLGIYGIDPKGYNPNLKPVLTLTTKIAQIKRIEKKESVGYDATFTAKKSMVLAILPIGYNDGVDRGLSNVGYVTYKEIPCPIIGRVSMNITTIDVSHVPDPMVGDSVVIYSDNQKDKNSLVAAAKIAKTIPYEILIHVDPHIRREIIL